MTIEEIQARVDALRTMDDERAHSEEDSLYRDVLRAIANGASDPAALAAAALLSGDIDFERWCA